ALADKLEGTVAALVADIPISSNGVSSWNSNISEGELDRMRWTVALGILEAGAELGLNGVRQSPETDIQPAAIAVIPQEKNTAATENRDYTLSAKILDGMVLDGRLDTRPGSVYCSTGQFRRLGLYESNARAFASNDEEYRKKISCSYTQVWLAYSQEGLIINSVGNHATPGKDEKPKFDNGDGHLWSENCMEYFFMVPEIGKFQLILSAYDKVVLITPDGRYLHEGIKVKSAHNINPANGLSQEMLIPWKLFGLNSMPERDTVWRFNACREFHSFNQLLTWSPVWQYFHEVNNWGNLHFSGASGDSVFKELSMPQLRPGRNVISGVVKPGTGALVLKDADGTTVQKIQPEANGSFICDFQIPNTSSSSAAWKLAPAGREDGAQIIPVIGGPAVSILSGEGKAIAGSQLCFKIFLCRSDLTAAESPLLVRLSKDSESINYCANFVKGGDNVIYIPTTGMKAGKWKLDFICDGDKTSVEVELAPAVGR
ncbi:MAG: hypothetical protein J6S21_07435, partial [Victivallales bacterium]|nr:hypothetical protein [Victivallales bacterium]